MKRKKEIEALSANAFELKDDEIYREVIERDVANGLTDKAASNAYADSYSNKDIRSANTFHNKNENVYMPYSSDTVCLGSEPLQERILKGRVGGKEVNIPLARLPLTIGKLESMSDFVINDASVSKMHARFEERGGKVCVCDLNSTNGTLVNGEIIDINTPIPLDPGDTLRFGRSSFTYL